MDTLLLLEKIVNKIDLTYSEAHYIVTEMMSGNLSHLQTAAFLTAFRMKGESVDEILAFITVLQKNMHIIQTNNSIIDTCGTGGDKSNTFNISTAVALVVAGSGVYVVKHGNRNISSNSGSADVLEKLGININCSPSQSQKMLETIGMTFCFAPLYHPNMQYVTPVRRELRIRTVFNIIGPFVNPARPKRQIIGVYNIDVARKLAKMATKLNYEHLLIVSSHDGMDEISISEPTKLFEVKCKKITEGIINPRDYGFNLISKTVLNAKNSHESAEIIKSILNRDQGRHRDITLLNAAAALYVAGRVQTIQDGIRLAAKSIDSGRAKKILLQLIKTSKKYENNS